MSEDELRRLQSRVESNIKVIKGENSVAKKVESSFSLFSNFELLVSNVNKSRQSGHRENLDRAEELLTDVAMDMLSFQEVEAEKSRFKVWLHRYWDIWKVSVNRFLFATGIFFASAFTGYFLGVHQPDYMPLLIGEGFMEQIVEKNKWFEALNSNPLIGAYAIASNNIVVSLKLFAFGLFLGFGGLLLLSWNGFFFGAVLGYCKYNGFDDPLKEFVLGHGPLELTILIIGGMASMIYGRVLLQFRHPEYKARLAKAFKEAFTVLGVAIPWLIVAAIIEGFVSPSTGLTLGTKFTVGILAFVVFWMFTFWPSISSHFKGLSRH